jgi:hypothetical protein
MPERLVVLGCPFEQVADTLRLVQEEGVGIRRSPFGRRQTKTSRFIVADPGTWPAQSTCELEDFGL